MDPLQKSGELPTAPQLAHTQLEFLLLLRELVHCQDHQLQLTNRALVFQITPLKES